VLKTPTSRLHAALALALLVGCASETGALSGDVDAEVLDAALTLEPPERGVQLQTSGVQMEPGDDLRWCEVMALPGTADDVYRVDRIEAEATAFARDIVVSAALPGSPTEAAMDPGTRVPCTRAGEVFGEEVELLFASQHRYLEQRMPRGVGYELHGGQRIAIESHYFNDSDEPSIAAARLNLHATPATLARLARTASFENFTIYTPPGGSSSHLAECRVSQPMVVTELVRRTQQRGTEFTVWRAGGERDGELLWHSAAPEDTHHEPTAPIFLETGAGFRFQCDYHNTSAFELRAGVTASDETCALQATWYSLDTREPLDTEGCLVLRVDEDGVGRD
jgi:hypothetical protein